MIELLDHGYIFKVEHWGSDQSIIEAARMSTDKGFLGWEPGQCPICMGEGSISENGEPPHICIPCEGKGKHPGDVKLLAYLYNHKHATPFEFAGLIIEVKAPIAVFREWMRHRTQGYNEMSGRYVPLPNENYVPTVERLMINASGTNKQAGRAKGAPELNILAAKFYRKELKEHYEADEKFYQLALAAGVPKELARMHLPVGRYSRMRATTSLRNWLGFLTLREAPGAQWEIRQYANAVNALLVEAFPYTMALFNNTEPPKAA